MKQTKYLFDNPVTGDWLFWVFIGLSGLNAIGAIQRVGESGGINTSTFSLVSGAIDALFVFVVSYILILPVFLIRKLIRKSRAKSEE
jgi:hypothetical protein